LVYTKLAVSGLVAFTVDGTCNPTYGIWIARAVDTSVAVTVTSNYVHATKSTNIRRGALAILAEATIGESAIALFIRLACTTTVRSAQSTASRKSSHACVTNSLTCTIRRIIAKGTTPTRNTLVPYTFGTFISNAIGIIITRLFTSGFVARPTEAIFAI